MNKIGGFKTLLILQFLGSFGFSQTETSLSLSPNGMVSCYENQKRLSYSVGYPFSENFVTSRKILTQGIQQPFDYLYFNGEVKTTSGSALKNVQINVNANQTFSTDNSGKFSIPLQYGSTNIIKPSNYFDKIPANGISTLDLLLLQAHILDKISLNSPYKIVAGDVNSDNKISTLDILYCKRLILNIDSTFPGNKLWTFVDSALQLDAINPFPYNDFISTGYYLMPKNNNVVYGIKLGDVNNDLDISLLKTKKNNDVVKIGYDETVSKVEREIIVPVSAKNAGWIMGLQGTLNYNVTNLKLSQISKGLIQPDINLKMAEKGNIPFLWIDKNCEGVKFNGNKVLFYLHFQNLLDENSPIEIQLVDSITKLECIGKNFASIPLSWEGKNPSMEHSMVNPSDTEHFRVEVYPNPSTLHRKLILNSDESQQLNITFSDYGAKKLMSFKWNVERGKNEFDLSLKNINLKPGMYYLTVIGKNNTKVVEMIIL